LRNLTDNIARYTPYQGEVKIGIESISDYVTAAFINSVQEFVPEDLPYLFERFFRGEKSRSRQHGGAGIGLAIVKELVEAHGGNVGAQLNDDKLRIWLTLPSAQSPPGPS
jgi:signal transduction histidine kinase